MDAKINVIGFDPRKIACTVHYRCSNCNSIVTSEYETYCKHCSAKLTDIVWIPPRDIQKAFDALEKVKEQEKQIKALQEALAALKKAERERLDEWARWNTLIFYNTIFGRSDTTQDIVGLKNYPSVVVLTRKRENER